MKKTTFTLLLISLALASFSQEKITTEKGAKHDFIYKQGNIGIGTNTPYSKLDINGSVRISKGNSIAFDRGSNDYSVVFDSYAFPSKNYPANGSANYWCRLASKGGTHIVLNTDGGPGAAENAFDRFTVWQGKVDGDDLFHVSNVGNTYIKGNLGLGTNTPHSKLDINGSVRISNGQSIAFDRGSNDYSVVFDSYAFPSKNYPANGSANYWCRLASKGGTHIVLNTDGGPGAAENAFDLFTVWQGKVDGDDLFHVSNVGNTYIRGSLGLGTLDTGTHKLAVEGSIGARKIEVEVNGWSDFVFNPDYILKPLDEVESFIKKNNHLPDIPSEEVVKEKGINLGEMDAKLLQKIEELTLYVIEQGKETKKLKEEITMLREVNGKITKRIKLLEEK